MNKYKIIFPLFVFLCMTVAIAAGYLYSYTLLFKDARVVQLEKWHIEGRVDSLKYRLLPYNDVRHFEYTHEIKRDELPQSEKGRYKVLVYRLASETYTLYWNGHLIGDAGEIRRTNLWNAARIYQIPDSLVHNTNTLTMNVYATYEIGGIQNPVFILDAYYSDQIKTWFEMILHSSPYFATGLLLFSFLLFFFLYLSMYKKQRYEYLFFSLASGLFIINLVNFSSYSHTWFPVFALKKCALISFYAAVICVSYGIDRYFEVKTRLVHLHASLIAIGSCVLILLPYRALYLTVYHYMNLLIALAPLYWIFISIRFSSQLENARLVTLVSVLLFVFGIFDALQFAYFYSSLFPLYLPALLILVITLNMLVLFDYLEINNRLTIESQIARFHYDKSIRDSMTGIYNHNFIINAVKRAEHPFSILMIDADKFKDINDKLGHDVGDKVIKLMARTLQESVRANDLVGRYGGDEFLILLHTCQEESAKRIAQKISDTVSHNSLSIKELKSPLTISIGIYSSGSKVTGSPLQNADQALYEAKKRGRNRYVLYKPGVASE